MLGTDELKAPPAKAGWGAPCCGGGGLGNGHGSQGSCGGGRLKGAEVDAPWLLCLRMQPMA